MVEAGEEPLAAAIREVQEETLITELEFAWGEEYTQTGPTAAAKSRVTTSPRLAPSQVTLPVIEELGRPEHNEFRWVDRAAATSWFRHASQPIIEWAAAHLARGPGS